MTRKWDPRPFREPLAFGISDAALLAFDMRTAVAVSTRASAALAGSPFGLLDAVSSLRLITDAVHEDDALCLALTCRALRDALWERFPATLLHWSCGGVWPGLEFGPGRILTRDAAVLASVSRLMWASRLDSLEWWQDDCQTPDIHYGRDCGRAARPYWLQHGRLDDEELLVKCFPEICVRAARHGAIWIMREARDRGCGVVEGMYVAAASAGQVRGIDRAKQSSAV